MGRGSHLKHVQLETKSVPNICQRDLALHQATDQTQLASGIPAKQLDGRALNHTHAGWAGRVVWRCTKLGVTPELFAPFIVMGSHWSSLEQGRKGTAKVWGVKAPTFPRGGGGLRDSLPTSNLR